MKKNEELSSSLKTMFSVIVIPAAIIIGIGIYVFILGNGINFQGGSHENAPLSGSYLGVIYKGGFIVPILMALLIIVLTFSIERLFTISKAKGKGSVTNFVKKIKKLVANNDK